MVIVPSVSGAARVKFVNCMFSVSLSPIWRLTAPLLLLEERVPKTTNVLAVGVSPNVPAMLSSA